jgi:hypothetical protein
MFYFRMNARHDFVRGLAPLCLLLSSLTTTSVSGVGLRGQPDVITGLCASSKCFCDKPDNIILFLTELSKAI